MRPACCCCRLLRVLNFVAAGVGLIRIGGELAARQAERVLRVRPRQTLPISVRWLASLTCSRSLALKDSFLALLCGRNPSTEKWVKSSVVVQAARRAAASSAGAQTPKLP